MRRLILILLAASVCAAAIAETPARATISPKSCGTAKVNGTTYRVRTHLLSCPRARSWSIAYLKRRAVPSGYRCRRFDRRVTRIAFTCFKGQRDFLAIRA